MGGIGSSGLLLVVVAVVSANVSPEDELTAHLFSGYNNLISPYVNRKNSSTHLQMSISLAQAVISSMNERDWTVRVLITVNYKWMYPRLRWEPSSYDEITEIAAKSSAVWLPDVYPCESSTSTTVLPEANSALVRTRVRNPIPSLHFTHSLVNSTGDRIRHTGDIALDAFQIITFNCPMNFDAFPFDVQHCLICFALEGFSGSTTVDLIDDSPEQTELLGNSEWRFVGNLSVGERRSEKDGVHIDRVGYHFSLARRPFFWVTLIIIPSCLICIVALVGIFFAGQERIVENAASIGLTTMTSLMLVVTVLADSLAKADNLPGLGWFVLIDIGIVSGAVIAALFLDHLRSLALSCSRRKDRAVHYACCLISKKTYRTSRVLLFLLSIIGLVLNVNLSWPTTSAVAINPFLALHPTPYNT